MKINCRACDICGEQLGSRDFQYWLRKPIIKGGCPSLGMLRMDICSDCFNKMAVTIQHQELFKQYWKEIDNEDSV